MAILVVALLPACGGAADNEAATGRLTKPIRAFFDTSLQGDSLPNRNAEYGIAVDADLPVIQSGPVSWHPVRVSKDSPLLADPESTLSVLPAEKRSADDIGVAYSAAVKDLGFYEVAVAYATSVRYLLQEFMASEMLWQADEAGRLLFRARQQAQGYYPAKDDPVAGWTDGDSDWYTIQGDQISHCATQVPWVACQADENRNDWRGPGSSLWGAGVTVEPAPLGPEGVPYILEDFTPIALTYSADDEHAPKLTFTTSVTYRVAVQVTDTATGVTVPAVERNTREISVPLIWDGDRFFIWLLDTSNWTPVLFSISLDMATFLSSFTAPAAALPPSSTSGQTTTVSLCDHTLAVPADWQTTDVAVENLPSWAQSPAHQFKTKGSDDSSYTITAACSSAVPDKDTAPTQIFTPDDRVYSIRTADMTGLATVSESSPYGADVVGWFEVDVVESTGAYYHISGWTPAGQAQTVASGMVSGLS